MTNRDLKAYEIGQREANKRQCIVTPNQSKELCDLLEAEKNNLLPLLKAFAKGVSDEIHRQTVLEFSELFTKAEVEEAKKGAAI